jgi:hypothetical protein
MRRSSHFAQFDENFNDSSCGGAMGQAHLQDPFEHSMAKGHGQQDGLEQSFSRDTSTEKNAKNMFSNKSDKSLDTLTPGFNTKRLAKK